MKKAIITGILGQDGSYMAELLSRKGYQVYGFVKEGTPEERITWLRKLIPNVAVISINLLDKSVLAAIKLIHPDEIYNFAGYSDVIDPWADIDTILDVNGRIPQVLLDVILKVDKSIRFFQASSCLIFGRDTNDVQNEDTPTNPVHLYGISKLYADNIVKEYRREFGLYCCSGIFFNHESERRKDIFFSRKITKAVAKAKHGDKSKTIVGNLSSLRDYGYAPDFIEAVYLMMSNKEPKDYVIGTGELISMEGFAKTAFKHAELNYLDYIEVNPQLYRKSDVAILSADITRISNDLGWKPAHDINYIVNTMVNYDINNYKS